ncbi:FKBP-type peptidyl-prolyl cis-trans isomerase [Tellurirhabdus bombi]|uniref:FKBP-type peptidyl-prolyl cis-trans isomerase n=1 Tax=Tellurirhabdus bombi TaxID=2907205 RepID=UPI001F24E6B1|nr:FKBP-type peptidyl-prolyl cis-trans isomerase [Tellurirhabdus bombi]
MNGLWKQGTVVAMFALAAMQISCQPDAGEAYNSRKLRENRADIEAYINDQKLQTQQTASGLYYTITQANANGQVPKVGDQVQFLYVKSRLDGVVVDSSVTTTPGTIISNDYFYYRTGGANQPYPIGLYEGLLMLKEGERATLLMPFNLQNQNQGNLLLPAFSPARYDVRVINVRTEDEQINDYVTAQKLTNVEKTSTGLRVAMTKTYPDSAQVKTGQTVYVKYTGRLLNGTQFDSNTAGTYSFKVGEGQVIKAWEEAIVKMKEGEKAIWVLPSAIGYGEVGSSNGPVPIPTYSPLAFDVEVVRAQ